MNKVLLYGRMTKDAELKTTGDADKSYTKFTIACNRRSKDGGADFIPCIAWGKTAETIANYFHKGNRISASGSVSTRNYKNKDGNNVYTTEILINEVEFVDTKSESGGSSESSNSGSKKVTPKPGTDRDEFMDIPDGLSDDLPFA